MQTKAKQGICPDIAKFDDFVEKTTTMKADFVQYINDQENASGVFLLKKPDKMLIDYKKGDINAVAGINGKIATYLDRDLGQISHIPQSKTPAYFVLTSKVKLSDTDLKHCGGGKDNTYLVQFRQKTDMFSGEFVLVFKLDGDKNPIELEAIAVKNEDESTARLDFTNVQRNIEISNREFTIKDPNL